MTQRVVICRSNPIAPDPRVEKEARALVQAGYQVTLLGWDRTTKLPPQDQIDGIPCFRLPIQAEYASGMRNLPDLLRWQWGLLSWLIRHREEYDLIHTCDFDTVLPALVCQRLYRKKVVYDIFDFYADHLRLTPEPVKKAIRALDLGAINRADAVILADESRREQIQGARPRLSAVIYNSPEDTSPQSSLPGDQAGKPQGSRLHIVYVGLLQVERGLFELIAVLRRHPEWSLSLAGFGGDEARITQEIQGMTNITWYGRVSYAKALQLSSEADALIATYDPAIPNHRFSSPNKVFEAMLLGKPIIVAQDTNMDRIINQADCGIVVTYGDETALEAALGRLQDQPSLRLRLGENARQAYDTTYSWQIMQHRLINLYEKLAN
jgi:glycosyltransferase involved in cell wall biosynthesis